MAPMKQVVAAEELWEATVAIADVVDPYKKRHGLPLVHRLRLGVHSATWFECISGQLGSSSRHCLQLTCKTQGNGILDWS